MVTHVLLVPAARLFEVLAASGLQHILHSNGWTTNLGANLGAGEGEEEDDDDEESDDDYLRAFRHRIRMRRNGGDQFPPVPNPDGIQLMGEGDFGTNEYYVDRLKKRKACFATNLMYRELGVDTYGVRKRADSFLAQVRWNN